jgi:site-specific recombinase XerC
MCAAALVIDSKLHLAAIRMLFDGLVVGQVRPTNPASSVRAPKHPMKQGKTPELAADEARTLLDAIKTTTLLLTGTGRRGGTFRT